MLLQEPTSLTTPLPDSSSCLVCMLETSKVLTAMAWLLAVATGGAAVELEGEAGGLDDDWFVLGLGPGLFSRVTATTAPATMTAAAATSPPISAPRERFGGCWGCWGG